MTDERDLELLGLFRAMPEPEAGDRFVGRVLAQLRRARRAQLRRRLIACAALLLGLALATPLLVEATLMLARFAAQAVALLLLQPYDPVGWATATLVGLLFLKRSIGARR